MYLALFVGGGGVVLFFVLVFRVCNHLDEEEFAYGRFLRIFKN